MKMNSRRRIIYNNDGTFILGNDIHGKRPITPDDVRDYVDLVADTPVTTFFMCTGSAMPYYRSRHERFLGNMEGCRHVSGSESPCPGDACGTYGKAVESLAAHGSDMVSLVIERCRQVGLEVMTSMRVNDLHFTDRDKIYPSAQADFWLDHPEYDLGDSAVPGWHSKGAANFEHAAVREYKLNLLQESIERFAPDGHEMDLMRFPVYFPAAKAKDCSPIMTDFIRKSRAIVKETAKKAGQERLFGVRLPASVEICKAIGFDPRGWCDEGLVDFITISAFFYDVPTLPVAQFRRDIGSPDVPIYAGLDHGVAEPRGGWGHFRACVANRWREKPDGLYFFNFFYHSRDGFNAFADKLNSESTPDAITRHGVALELLCELSDPSRLRGRNKIYNAGSRMSGYGADVTFDLPSEARDGAVEFRLPMAEGKTKPGEAILFLRVAGAGTDWTVTFNGATCRKNDTDAGLYRLNEKLAEGRRIIAFSVSPASIKDGDNVVRVECPGASSLSVDRADCVVIHGPADTHGYF
jgi:hypothetical protein